MKYSKKLKQLHSTNHNSNQVKLKKNKEPPNLYIEQTVGNNSPDCLDYFIKDV